MRIAIDIASGDRPAETLLPGALQGARETGAELLLVGNRAQLLNSLGKEPFEKIELIDSPDIIGMQESPVRALISKPNASVAVAGALVASGRADLFMSPGNTGASLVVASRILGNLPGVIRPALAACLAGYDNPFVLLDVGAGAEAKPVHLCQFAVMGAAYAQAVLGLASPRVGLLNNGIEPGKGIELYKKAYAGMEKMDINFVGNLEGFELFSGKADVIVTDGFTGNILSKSISATTSAALDWLGHKLGSGVEFENAAARPRVLAEQKGAVQLLGVKGGCLVLHGRAGADDVAEAVRIAAAMIHGGVGSLIGAKLNKLVGSAPME